VPHPNPFKAAQGRTKTRLMLDPDRAPVVTQIYTWRIEDKLGVNAIVARLNADHAGYPPADPAAGWSLGGVSAILGNPKYTGYQVFGRRRRGRPVPVEQWHWSPAPAHSQIIDRATWDAAQAAGAEHGSTRDGDDPNPHPATRRTYVLRSRVRCKLCRRRMTGITRTHRDRGTRGDYAYYICQFDPGNPRHAAAVPGHPRTVAARQDLLLATLRDGLAAYALAPGRAARLAELLPAGAAEAQARHDAQAATLRLRLKQTDAAERNLITELNNAAGMPPKASDAYRARIREQFVTLCGERETITGQLDALDKDAGRHGTDPALLDELPELAGRLDELPERLQAELFAAFDIQILWNAPMKQATFFATITDTTPGIVAALLDRAGDNDPATATAVTASTDPDQAPANTSTFSVPPRSGISLRTLPRSWLTRRRADEPMANTWVMTGQPP
jgi:site-specific DNA recombinase